MKKQVKKCLKKFLVVMLTLVLMMPAFTDIAYADETGSDFVILDGILLFYTGNGGKVTIPDDVEMIYNNAFAYCGDKLTEIKIPDSVVYIGDNVFNQCTKLTKIAFSKKISYIGKDAFAGTKWLKNQQKKNPLVVVNGILVDGSACKGKVTIPSKVKSIGPSAFSDNQTITGVKIPGNVKYIELSAFQNCTNLTDITISKKVKAIRAYAFDNTKWMQQQWKKNPCVVINGILVSCDPSQKNVKIPDGVTEIGDAAFQQCTGLTSIDLSKCRVKNIGSNAFEGCKKLKSVKFPNTLTSIGEKVFKDCEKLESITLSNKLKSINSYTFQNCICLKKIAIPNSVESIGENAFNSCLSLQEIIIPESVKKIEKEAFCYCKSLNKVVIPDTIRDIDHTAFVLCDSITDVTAPERYMYLFKSKQGTGF